MMNFINKNVVIELSFLIILAFMFLTSISLVATLNDESLTSNEIITKTNEIAKTLQIAGWVIFGISLLYLIIMVTLYSAGKSIEVTRMVGMSIIISIICISIGYSIPQSNDKSIENKIKNINSSAVSILSFSLVFTVLVLAGYALKFNSRDENKSLLQNMLVTAFEPLKFKNFDRITILG